MAESVQDEMQQNANFITDILDCASKWLENKKGKRKGDKYYLETYLEDVKLLFSADCCVVKAKCYRSMRKTEAPHSLRIVFDSGEVGTQSATQCSCKAGTGKCQHLAALFTHVMAKLRDDDSPTSHLQQWHRPRGPSLEPQRWFESEFVKPRIDRTPREMAPKTVQEYLYDPRPVEQRIITETDIKKLGENISVNNPTTYASWLQYSNSANYQSLPWGNFLEGSPLANQLRDVYPRSVVETIYSEDLEAVFDFPVQIISLPEDVRKGPPPSLPDEEKAFLANIILSPEKAIDIEKNTRSQSSCSAWYQERAFRITASRFGDVVSRKAPINDKFLHSLFALTKVQTQAMKYGLDMEPTVVKEFKELTGPQVEVFKCGLLVHPDIYWMGCSPDGIIYDPNENPSVGILEIKSLFSLRGKSIDECLNLRRDLCIYRDEIGAIRLKRNHKFFFQLQGLMGISGLLWSKICIHSKEGSQNLFVEKIEFDSGVFHNLASKVHKLYFSHCLPYLLRK